MCPLQIINDIEHLRSTFHGINRNIIHHPSNVKFTEVATSWKTIDKNKKNFNYVFFHLYEYLCIKIIVQMAESLRGPFSICKIYT